MTIVNMVGGGGIPEGEIYTLDVLTATSISTLTTIHKGNADFSRYSTLTYNTGSVTLYPELGCYKVEPADISRTSDISGVYGTGYFLTIMMGIPSTATTVYDKIYDLIGGLFYIEFRPYYKEGSYYYIGDIVRILYRKGSTTSTTIDRAYVETSGSRPTSVYLIPIGIHPYE